MNVLLQRSRTVVMAHHETLLPALFDALNAPSDRVVEEAVTVQVIIRRAVLTHIRDAELGFARCCRRSASLNTICRPFCCRSNGAIGGKACHVSICCS